MAAPYTGFMRLICSTIRRDRSGGGVPSRVAVAVAIALLVTAAAVNSAKSASALCSDPYQPGCVLPQGEPDQRTIRERLANPVPDLVERPDKQRATISQPSYSLPGPPIFLDIQGPRVGR